MTTDLDKLLTALAGKLPLFSQLPTAIAPRLNALVVSCLTAPACMLGTMGLEVEYSPQSEWRKRIRP